MERTRFTRFAFGAGLLSLGLMACADSATQVAAPEDLGALAPLLDHVEDPLGLENLTVCKFNDAPDTEAQFSISGDGGTLPQGNLLNLVALPFGDPWGENCAEVWQSDGTTGPYPVTVTEVDMTAGTVIDQIWVLRSGDSDFTVLTGQNSVTLDLDVDHGGLVLFKNEGEGGDGGEGCTPGAWKNRLWKRGFWPATYADNPSLSEHFDTSGFDFGDDTFLEALNYRGHESRDKVEQEAYKLMRSAVAALLNAASQDYAFSQAEIVAATEAALASGDWVQMNDLKDQLDFENNRGCAFD